MALAVSAANNQVQIEEDIDDSGYRTIMKLQVRICDE